ncbi:unnamed protein product [Cochlearia groenlandica]
MLRSLKSYKRDTLSNYSEVYSCWRMIKEGIATPLLIDLCYKTGFVLPPYFMRLPPDLKLKITRLLLGVYIARLACVSSELRNLASDDDLWRQKCVEEDQALVVFGYDDEPLATYKDEYVRLWRRDNHMRRAVRPYHILNR